VAATEGRKVTYLFKYGAFLQGTWSKYYQKHEETFDGKNL
jgi:hypothetical protein